MKLGDRPTGDLLLLMVAGTVCLSVLLIGGGIATIALLHPETNTSAAASVLSDVLNTLIGLLAGFLAGRTDATRTAAQ